MKKIKFKIKNLKKIFGIIGIIIVLILVIMGILFIKEEFTGNDTEAFLKVTCGGETINGLYTKDDEIKCDLLGEEYIIEVNKIKEDVVYFKTDKVGLFPRREDGTISLRDKVKKFELEKGNQLVLALQVTDTSEEIIIDWE